jgi:hypothetical protein
MPALFLYPIAEKPYLLTLNQLHVNDFRLHVNDNDIHVIENHIHVNGLDFHVVRF